MGQGSVTVIWRCISEIVLGCVCDNHWLCDEIHILGSVLSPTSHYKWNGSSWTSVSTLPYSFYYGSVVVFINQIHMLGGSDTGSGNGTKTGKNHCIITSSSYDKLYLPI